MKRIWVVCNTGFGSSLFVEMNVRDILQRNGLEDRFEAGHGALYDTDWSGVSVVVVARDLAPHLAVDLPMVVLDSIIDAGELEGKLLDLIGREG